MSIDRLWCFYRFDRLWVGARLSLMLRCSGGRVVTRIQNLDCYYYQQSEVRLEVGDTVNEQYISLSLSFYYVYMCTDSFYITLYVIYIWRTVFGRSVKETGRAPQSGAALSAMVHDTSRHHTERAQRRMRLSQV
jgi:hypothetical protein